MSDMKPIDTSKIHAPVKAVLMLDGGVGFAPFTDAPAGVEWAGLWAFPDAPVWTPEDRDNWAQVNGHKIHETKALEAAVAALDAAANSPSAMLAQTRLEVSEVTRAREAAERRKVGEAAWLKARESLGAGCARVDGEEGDVFILRRPKEIEIIHVEHMAELGSSKHPPDSMMAKTERAGARLNGLIAIICHPTPERARQQLTEYPLLQGYLYAKRDQMILGYRYDQGKDSAP